MVARKCVGSGKTVLSILMSKQKHSTRLPAPLYPPPRFFTTTTIAAAESQLRRSPAYLPCSRRISSLPSELSRITSFATHSDDSNPNPIPTADALRDPSIVDVNVAGKLSDDHYVSVQSEEERKEEVLEELSRSVRYLTCDSSAEGGSCDVYIVGVNHLSQKSCGAVETAIRFLEPQVVFLELCSSRVAFLTKQNSKVPTVRDITGMLGKENLLGMTFNWCLAKAASRHQATLGSEFLVACEEARKCSAKVILGDRDIQITWQRTWAKMPLLQKAKFLYYLLFKTKEMNGVDMETEFPTLMETLVHERDQFMSSTLLTVASKHSCVVAVVGKGHIEGIEKHWKRPAVAD